jgi:hypothetical protein
VDEVDDTCVIFNYDGTSSSDDDLSGTLTAYSKEVDDDANDERLLFRVQD